jgi:hypothetical protein
MTLLHVLIIIGVSMRVIQVRLQLLEQLKAGGVEVAFALPVSSLSVFKVRPDLRLHRKTVYMVVLY